MFFSFFVFVSFCLCFAEWITFQFNQLFDILEGSLLRWMSVIRRQSNPFDFFFCLVLFNVYF